MNKTDMLPDDAEREKLLAIMASLNPLAAVIPCQEGKVRGVRTCVWVGGCGAAPRGCVRPCPCAREVWV